VPQKLLEHKHIAAIAQKFNREGVSETLRGGVVEPSPFTRPVDQMP
jgi:hypothetical protein